MEIKIQVLWIKHNRDFTKTVAEHYTTVSRLCSGKDNFNYDAAKVITKRQFTNAYDTNSKEMYVNDLVMVDGLGKCTVKICAYYGVVFVDSKGQECAMVDSMTENDSFYVIGNIHQGVTNE